MKIKSFQGGFDKNLSYLIWCESTHIAGIVDASVNMTEINKSIEIHALNLEKIFITHTHSDHIQFLDDILFQFPHVQLYGYEKPEIETSKSISNNPDREKQDNQVTIQFENKEYTISINVVNKELIANIIKQSEIKNQNINKTR